MTVFDIALGVALGMMMFNFLVAAALIFGRLVAVVLEKING